jgi:AraC-like DNA-binding protein
MRQLVPAAQVDYREIPPSPALAGLIKTFWTLEGSGPAGRWIEQQATPDGCVEIIRRLRGRSRWGEAQPERFAVGLIEAPEPFAISGDSRFAGVRLWPWAWPLLAAIPLESMRGRWVPYDGAAAGLLPDFAAVERLLAGHERLNAIGLAIVAAGSVAEMEASGMAPRALQRWFARHVGMPPRRYLRLLRFQKAFEGVAGDAPLADQAAEHGFADQAHMARTFREMAGVPAKQARRSARGPFLT